MTWTQADYEAGYAFNKKYLGDDGKIDTVLNNLDALKKSLAAASQAASKAGNASLVTQIASAESARGRHILALHRRLSQR